MLSKPEKEHKPKPDTMYHCPDIFKVSEGVLAVESTRLGGVSKGAYASLNLGLYTDDDPSAVAENRMRFFGDLDIDLHMVAGSRQVHGMEILHVHTPGHYEGFDALITRENGIFLTVTVADCTPILLYDRQQQAVAAIHAGWRGSIGGIVPHTLTTMATAFGSSPSDCLAYIGTCIDACSFEVDEDVGRHFQHTFKTWNEDRQKYLIDLKAYNKQQLMTAGIPEKQIEVSPFSTVLHNDTWYSYRKEGGKTGRMLGVIGLKK